MSKFNVYVKNKNDDVVLYATGLTESEAGSIADSYYNENGLSAFLIKQEENK